MKKKKERGKENSR